MATPTDARERRASDFARGMVLVIALVAVMWMTEVVDLFAGNLDGHGIEPREVDGLPGIVFAPFLHAGFGHLIGNTVPFVILGAGIAVGGLARVAAVVVIVALIGGLGTWLSGPAGSDHIGASGLVFGFAAYLLTRGLFSRSLMHLAVGAIVLAVYGLTLVSGFVPEPGVSWQGHVFGAIGGIVAARVLHGRRRGDRRASGPSRDVHARGMNIQDSATARGAD